MPADKKINRIKKDLAKNLTTYRKERNHTYEALSEKTNLDKELIKQIENGASNPSLKDIVKISAALEVPIHTLLSPESNQG